MDSSSIISQIKGVESFFASQVRIGICPEVLEQSKASMTRSLVAQIGELRTLDVEGAAVLNTTIAESGSFDTSHKTMLASAVSSKALQPTGAHGGPHKGTQSLLNPICYFTKADWDVFEDAQANLTKKVVVAARRLHLLNLTNPSEATVKQLAGMLAACHFKDAPPTAQQTYGLVVDIKNVMSQNRKRPVFTQHLAVYPPSPSDLPTPVFESAYPQEADFPVTRVLDNLTVMTGAIVMRSSNKRVAHIAKNAALVPVEHQQHQQGAQFQGNMGMNIVNALLQGLAAHASNGRSTDNPLIHIFGPAARGARDALPLRDALPGLDAAASVSASRESPPGVSSHGMDAPEAGVAVADHIEVPSDHESDDSGNTALEKMEAVAGGGKKIKKRPASAAPRAKRPASAAAVAGKADSHRPPVPQIAMGTRVDYKTGKVLVSVPGQCFRAFKQTSDRVDLKFTWKRQTQQEAWNAALDFIDGM